MSEKRNLVKTLVEYEWKAFDQVQGMDGRASCQDDYETFQIMRSSQFYVWTQELLESYLVDMETAMAEGQNLITQKYAFMMKSTDPANFQQLEPHLPSISSQKAQLIEEIVALQLEAVVELYPKYPKFVQQGRSLRSNEDSLYNTSYETYLRGELCSYSEKTVSLYYDMLKIHQEKGWNTAKLYMETVAHQYGYPDLQSAEDSILC